jgi:hypothetical protein
MALWLAQTKSIAPYVTWIGVMMGALTLVAIALLVFRAKVLGKDQGLGQGMLDDLRAMRDRGEITPEEFEAARSAMIARLKPTPAPGVATANPAAAAKPKGALVARPGFDLTGRPLPKPDETPDR